MTKRLFLFGGSLAIATLFVMAGFVQAQIDPDTSSITYPVTELGGCETEDACYTYCSDAANFEACYAFGVANGLIDADESISTVEELLEEHAGPGGCTSDIACEAYCSDINNLDECLDFAEEQGFMSEAELDEARQVQAALDAGATLPGGCTGKDDCEAYCEDPANMEECFAFAEAAGFLDEEEIEEARAAMELMASGNSPGGCASHEACEAYCEDEAHFEECIAFAEEAGFISEEEAEHIRDVGSFGGPGGCSSEAECEAYCQDDANMDECIAFSLEAGFITEEEAEMFRSTGGQGPGGCEGEAECEEYCTNPDNTEECIAFATEHGMMSEEEAQMMMEMGQDGFHGGPGGCETEDECAAYCVKEENEQECSEFFGEFKNESHDDGGYNEEYDYDDYDENFEMSGPGGCSSESDCMLYCMDPANLSECLKFGGEEHEGGDGDENWDESDETYPFGELDHNDWDGDYDTDNDSMGDCFGLDDEEECELLRDVYDDNWQELDEFDTYDPDGRHDEEDFGADTTTEYPQGYGDDEDFDSKYDHEDDGNPYDGEGDDWNEWNDVDFDISDPHYYEYDYGDDGNDSSGSDHSNSQGYDGSDENWNLDGGDDGSYDKGDFDPGIVNDDPAHVDQQSDDRGFFRRVYDNARNILML